MKLSFAMVGLLAVAGAAGAQVSYTGGTYSENFDQLPSTTPSPSPFSPTIGLQHAIPGMTNPWHVTKLSGTGTGNMPFTADAGTNNSGGIFSYGAVGSGERALGSLASGSNVPGFGVMITNNTGTVLTSFTISFTQEIWRTSTATDNVLTFGWATSNTAGVNDSNFLSASGFNADALNSDVIGLPFVTTNGAVNPPATALRGNTYNFTLNPGDRLYLRWQDFNDVGNDGGLSIDDFHFSAVPTPGAFGLAGLAGVAALRRRRA